MMNMVRVVTAPKHVDLRHAALRITGRAITARRSMGPAIMARATMVEVRVRLAITAQRLMGPAIVVRPTASRPLPATNRPTADGTVAGSAVGAGGEGRRTRVIPMSRTGPDNGVDLQDLKERTRPTPAIAILARPTAGPAATVASQTVAAHKHSERTMVRGPGFGAVERPRPAADRRRRPPAG